MLLDAAGIMYRGHFGFASSPLIRLSDSRHTSALYSFCNLLLSLLSSYRPTHLAAVLDVPTSSAFRRSLYPQYKAHRPTAPSELTWQLRHLPVLCRRIGLATAHHEGFEADDVIASIVHQQRSRGSGAQHGTAADSTTAIVSQDKDFVQLLDDHTALLRFTAQPASTRGVAQATSPDPSPAPTAADSWKPVGLGSGVSRNTATFSLTPFTSASCLARYSIPPSRFVDYLALTGDATDGIPGVAGVGAVTASKLLREWETLERVVDAAVRGEVGGRVGVELAKEGMREEVEKWRTLVRMRKDLPVPPLEDMRVDGWWEEGMEGEAGGEGAEGGKRELRWEGLLGGLEELEFPTLVEKAKRLREEEMARRGRGKEGREAREEGREGLGLGREGDWRGLRHEQRVVQITMKGERAVQRIIEEEEQVDGEVRHRRTLVVGHGLPT